MQSASLPTPLVTPAAMHYTSEPFQELSAKVAHFAVETSTVRGERDALHASAAAPVVSTEDCLMALSVEMVKITKQIDDLPAENTAFKIHEPTPRAASGETTAMFPDFMPQQTAISSANKAATKELSRTMSNFMKQLIENQNARPAGDPRPVHPSLNPPDQGPAAPSTIVLSLVPGAPAFPSY